MEELELAQPNNGIASSPEEAIEIAENIGYPVVIRPSYVLGGRAMEIVRERASLERYIKEAVVVSGSSPVSRRHSGATAKMSEAAPVIT